MKRSEAAGVAKKFLEGGLTAAFLAFLMYDGHGHLRSWRKHSNKNADTAFTAAASPWEVARHRAFLIAQQDIVQSLPPGATLGWCSETNVTFTRTADADFIALQADHLTADGGRVDQHWIVRLDPKSGQVLGKVTWEVKPEF